MRGLGVRFNKYLMGMLALGVILIYKIRDGVSEMSLTLLAEAVFLKAHGALPHGVPVLFRT